MRSVKLCASCGKRPAVARVSKARRGHRARGNRRRKLRHHDYCQQCYRNLADSLDAKKLATEEDP